MPCKNICFQFKAMRSHAPNCQYYLEEGRYDNGQKRCQICDIFIKWSGSRCPCCHTSLRTRPRPKKYREIIAKEIQDLGQTIRPQNSEHHILIHIYHCDLVLM
jgi:hypothetical protein